MAPRPFSVTVEGDVDTKDTESDNTGSGLPATGAPTDALVALAAITTLAGLVVASRRRLVA